MSEQHGALSKFTAIGPDIWMVDGSRIKFLGLLIGTRMTIVRLRDGRLWIHSPIALTPELSSALDALGPISLLVAPNKFHHLFLKEWVDAYPSARVFAAPGLRGKRKDISFDAELTAMAPDDWRDEIDQTIFAESRAFDEIVFFHKTSRTLILTDIIVNVRLDGQSFFARAFARIDGVSYPNGTTPLLYKLSMKDKEPARAAVLRMLEWNPSAVVISHGEWFQTNGADELRRRLAWAL
jgi:hypothetical protein